MNNIGMAFILTILASFSTLLGTIPIFFKIKKEILIICFSLAFASGVMLSISVIDLVPEAFILLNNYNDIVKLLLIFFSILLGIIVSNQIDKGVFKLENNSLYRVGIISMFAIIMHNVPEGIITFISTTKDVKLGIALALAIALHNIPEGISTSIPIYYSTNSKIKAFICTFISGISELFGAIITYLFLSKIITNNILGLLLAITAGIMIYISLIELLPNSLYYDNRKLTMLAFLMGFIIVIMNLCFKI